MAKLRNVKEAQDIQLDGISVELDIVGSILKQVTLTDGSGNLVKFGIENYALWCVVEEEPELKTRYCVSCTWCGVDVTDYFNDHAQAQHRKSELENAGGVDVQIVSEQYTDLFDNSTKCVVRDFWGEL